MSINSDKSSSSSKRLLSYRELEEEFDKPRLQNYAWFRNRVEGLYPDRSGVEFDGLVLWLLFNLENLNCLTGDLWAAAENALFHGWTSTSSPTADMKNFNETCYNRLMSRAKTVLPLETQTDPRFKFAVRCLSRSRVPTDNFEFKAVIADFLQRFKVTDAGLKQIPEDFVLETLEVYQKRYLSVLTVQDALEIIIDVGRLFDLAKGKEKL